MPLDLAGLDTPRLAQHLADRGLGAHHAGRVVAGLHRHGRSVAQIPDVDRATREALCADSWVPPVNVVGRHPSPDGSERVVFELHDGARVEGVLLPSHYGDRATLCLSSQVGCAMACRFCATGTLGLSRNLLAGEIVGQVTRARELLSSQGRRLTHLVFMGMGEPLHNAEAVTHALDVLFDPHGLPFARRHVTVSTVGLLRPLAQLGERFGGKLQLAVSLHAGTDATRRRLLPVAKAVSLAQLKEALLAHPFPGNQKLMLEYVVLPGVNDGDDELDGLQRFTEGLPAVVNLIPFNPFAGAIYRSPTDTELRSMWEKLKARGVMNTVRWPRGRQAQGACGQLMLQPTSR
jgi:23S rRNA (adenine2503-C2)-methyltransferase